MRRPASAAAPGTRNDILMNIVRKLVILSAAAALAGAVASCSEDAFMEQAPQTGDPRKIEVRIAATATRGADAATARSLRAEATQNPTVYVGGEAPAATPQTRIAFDENDGTMRWTKGDRIALWSYSSGAAAFENVPFTLWYPREDPSQGLFTGQVNAMAAGTYDYYAACPVPESAAGTKVTYTIPTVQNGRWNPDLDIMLAKTSGAELREEILNDVTLRFRHQVHAFKITVPEGRNLLGGPIEKLRIEFGLPVAGRMTWDLANPDAAPEGAGAATGITLAFDTPVDEGDSFWVYLAPADLTGVPVRFTATDGTEFSWPLTGTAFRNCTAGTITPVKLTIGELRPQQEYRLMVDPAHLGEPVTRIDSIVMPENYEFPSLELRNVSEPIAVDADGTCTTKYFEDQPNPFTVDGYVRMSVSSENTEGVYGKRCDVRDATADGCTVMSPYLFFEDFSNVVSFNSNDNHGSGSHVQNPDAIQLDQYGLPGWTGARTGAEGGNAVRCCCHFEGALIAYGRYNGRIDSPAIGVIRSGKRVDVTVTYDYTGGTTQSGKRASPLYTYGYTTRSGAFKGNEDIESQIEGGISLSKTGDYGSIDQTKTYTIPDCTSSHRLSWQVSNDGKRGDAFFGDYFLYLDNIRVTIAH